LVKSVLKKADINFEEKVDLVRGLDYYTGIVFEVVSGSLGSQDAVAAGGRYDDLCLEMGGPDKGATGFAIGVERLVLAIDPDKYNKDWKEGAFISLLDKKFASYGFSLVDKLRRAGVTSEWDPTGRSFKAQMRKADRQKWSHVIVVGEDEVETGKLTLKNMDSGQQVKIELQDIIKKFKKKGKDD
jgi:histidyl-tRNA synthetase